MSPRTGRRAGATGTRDAILDSARQRFADRGYAGATIRGIAADAGVDPALVHHFYGSKEQLFVAAMRLEVAPGEILTRVMESDAGRLGEAVVRAALRFWESPGVCAAALGLLRSAVSNERAAAMLRDFVGREIVGRIAAGLGVPDARYRASLVASHVLGLAMARYVVRLEPIASASVEELVGTVGPALQRYLSGDLGS